MICLLSQEQMTMWEWFEGNRYAIRSVKLGWIIWHVLEHRSPHRGELWLILGLLGRDGLDVMPAQ